MAHHKARRRVLFGAVVGAVLLGLASAAFACSSNWVGELIVSGPGGTVTGLGSKGGVMVYCSNSFPKGTISLQHNATNVFTVQMHTGIDGCTAQGGFQFNGRAELNIVPSVAAFPTTRANGVWSLDTLNGDCHSNTTRNAGGDGVLTNIAGTLKVPNNGSVFGWTVVYTAGGFVNNAGQAAGLCIGDVLNNSYGMEVPIVFV